MNNTRTRKVLLSAALVALPACYGHAAPVAWIGGTATAPHWDQPNNWNPAAKPTAVDDVTFPTPIPAIPGAVISLGAGELANSLTFNAGYTLGAAAGGGDLTVTTGNIAVASGVTANIASQLKGTTGITLTGGGTLGLTNTTTTTTNNTFSGGINLSGGSTLQFAVEAALGSATTNNITFNGGTLQSTATTGTLTLTSTRIFNVASTGTLTTAGSSTNGKIAITGAQLTGAAGTIFTKTGGGDFQITSNSAFAGTFNVSGLVEASTNAALGTGAVNVNSGGELALGNNTTAFANALTLNTGAVISPIGGSGGNITGTINAAGNFSVALRDFNNAANGRNFTLSGPLSGAGNLTTIAPTGGNATAFLSNANNSAYSGNISVAAGTGVSFTTANSKGTGTLTVASSATALGALGIGFVPATQSALPTIDTNSTAANGGVFEVNVAGFNTLLDLNTLYGSTSSPTGGSAGKWFLGSATTGTYTNDALGASSDGNYRLGGAGGTLNITPTTANAAVLSGANNLIVGAAAINGGGTVVIGTNGNSFSGGVTVANGTLSVANVENGGINSPLGSGTGPITLGSATTAGTFTYTGAASDSTDRGITLAGAGTINVNTAAATLTVGPLSGTGILTKASAGTLTLPGPVNAAGGITLSAGTINVNGATSNAIGAVNLAAGTMNLNGAAATGTTLTMATGTTLAANNGATFSGAASITGTTTLSSSATTAVTVNSAVTVGPNAASNLTLGTGTSFVMNASGSNFIFGNRTTLGANINDAFNATNARNVSITANNIQIGTTSGAPINTGTSPLITFSLPTGATSTSNLTATTAILVGLGDNSGNDLTPTAVLNLGGGTNTIITPLLQLGEEKRGARVGFATGSAGSLTLTGAAGGKANLLIGDNALSGTGTAPLSTLDLTTTGTVTATLGNITLANTSANNANGGARGTFTLAASGVGTLVTADKVIQGVSTGGANTNVTSTFNLGAGTFRFNNAAGNGFTAGTGTVLARTTSINVSGGVLDMNGLALTAVATGTGTSTLALTGGTITNASSIGTFTNLNFTGGTLNRPGTISQPLTQNGPNTLIDVNTNDATINGAYTLTSGTLKTASARKLTVTASAVVGSGGTFEDVLSPGVASASLVVSTTLDLTATGDTLRIDDLSGTGAAFDGTTTYTLATFASRVNDSHFDVVSYFDGTTLSTFTDAQATSSGALPNGYAVVYNSDSIQLTPVPEPTTLSLLALGGVSLLARRRRRAN